MREINVKVTRPIEIIETKIATKEIIHSILERKTNKEIEVGILLQGSDGEILKDEYYMISGENYSMLMSDSPSFAIGKPENEYREIDLWHVIDLIRTERGTNPEFVV